MRFVVRLLISLLLFFSLAVNAAEEGKEPAAVKANAYFDLSPSLVLNVKGNARYMRCDVQLMARDEAKIAAISLHAPALRHELILLFSDQQGQNIKTTQGKERETAAATKKNLRARSPFNIIVNPKIWIETGRSGNNLTIFTNGSRFKK